MSINNGSKRCTISFTRARKQKSAPDWHLVDCLEVIVDRRRLMKRLGFFIVIAAVAAGAVVYTVRHLQSTPHANVTALLPDTTLALGHMPDFKRTRDEWHASDLYRLYQEPAVQEF